jgi:hypothetical protein
LISQTVTFLHAAHRPKQSKQETTTHGQQLLCPRSADTSQNQKKCKKGHMEKQHQRVQSTRMLAKNETSVPALPKLKDIYMKIHNATRKMHGNQTECFPATSSRGNKYIMVLV